MARRTAWTWLAPLLALSLSACGGATRPSGVLLLDDDREAYAITPALRRVLYTDAATSPERAATLDTGPVRGVRDEGPVWLRFDVACPPGARRDWTLSLGPPYDEGTLYTEPPAGEPRAAWRATPLPPPTATRPMPLSVREGTQTFLLRLERLTTAPSIFALTTARGHARTEALVLGGQGAYLGIAALVVLLNAHLVRRRQRTYTIYVLYVIASAGFFALRLGVVARFLTAPRAALLAPELALLAAAIALGTQFSRELLQTRTELPRWDRVLRAYMAVAVALAVLAVSTRLGYAAVQAVGLALPPLAIVTGLLARRRHAASARPFLLGWTSLSLGALAFALPSAGGGVVDGVVLFQIGSTLEMVLLLRAIVVRYKALEDEQLARAATAARAERLATLGRLAVGVAHEINNPNNLITFNLPVLRRYLAATEPELRARAEAVPDLSLCGLAVPEFLADADKLITQTEQGAQRIASIVSDLKGYVRTGADDAAREAVVLDALVARAVALVPAPALAGVELQVTATHPGARVSAVPTRLEQVVTNLVVNAAEACVGTDGRRVVVSTRRDGGHAIVEVADSGPGLSDEARARLFEPFFTTKGKGLGLGLAITHAIVAGHGGSIEVIPNAPRGTRFIVRFPSLEEHPA